MKKIAPKKIIVRVKGVSHPIVIGMHLEKELLHAVAKEGARCIIVIADSTTRKLFGSRIVRLLKKTGLKVDIVSFRAGEHRKNQATVSTLHHTLQKKHCGRDTLLVALGGGVVGDVAGFVAATYMRGIPYIQVPTTFLAMIDSSIGGKVGVDTKHGKNLIGAFYQPRAVITDLAFASSLTERQVVNGLMEVVKKFLTSDKRGLPLAFLIDPRNPMKDPRLLQEVMYHSVKTKVRIIMADEEEKNERRVLNFGHTVGHAIEFLSGYKLPHGFAIGHGMLLEAKISELLGILPAKDFSVLEALLARFGAKRSTLKKYPVGKILQAAKGDKKTRRGVPHYVLLKTIGSVYTKGGQYAHPVPDRIVRKAYASLVY